MFYYLGRYKPGDIGIADGKLHISLGAGYVEIARGALAMRPKRHTKPYPKLAAAVLDYVSPAV